MSTYPWPTNYATKLKSLYDKARSDHTCLGYVERGVIHKWIQPAEHKIYNRISTKKLIGQLRINLKYEEMINRVSPGDSYKKAENQRLNRN